MSGYFSRFTKFRSHAHLGHALTWCFKASMARSNALILDSSFLFIFSFVSRWLFSLDAASTTANRLLNEFSKRSTYTAHLIRRMQRSLALLRRDRIPGWGAEKMLYKFGLFPFTARTCIQVLSELLTGNLKSIDFRSEFFVCLFQACRLSGRMRSSVDGFYSSPKPSLGEVEEHRASFLHGQKPPTVQACMRVAIPSSWLAVSGLKVESSLLSDGDDTVLGLLMERAYGAVHSVFCYLLLKHHDSQLIVGVPVGTNEDPAKLLQSGATKRVHGFLQRGPISVSNSKLGFSSPQRSELYGSPPSQGENATILDCQIQRCRDIGNSGLCFSRQRSIRMPFHSKCPPYSFDAETSVREAQKRLPVLKLGKLTRREIEWHCCGPILLHRGSDLLSRLCRNPCADQQFHHPIQLVELPRSAYSAAGYWVIKDAGEAAHHGLDGDVDTVHSGLSLGKDKAKMQAASCGPKLHHKGLRKWARRRVGT